MATRQISTILQQIRRAALAQDGAGMTDGQLLESFLAQHDEAAFESLLRRHGPMVLGVCYRILRNQHDAEDAFQATFLVFARKASSVRPRERIANWLHGVAHRTALKARTFKTKSQVRERQVSQVPEPEAVENDHWNDLQPVLDEELGRLPENYRLPLLLCDLEGKSIKEATLQLGWPQGTLAGRLARARKMLAKRLTQRGITLSGGALALVLSEKAASACVPAALAAPTIKAAVAIAAGQPAATGIISANVAALTEGVLKAMMLTKLKTVTAILLMLSVVAYGGGTLARHTAAAYQDADDEKKPAKVEGKKDAFNSKMKTPTAGSKQADIDATRDLAVAEFYHRTGHFGSAHFYCELVKRRYPDTDFAKKAAQLLVEVNKHRIRLPDGSDGWEAPAPRPPDPQPVGKPGLLNPNPHLEPVTVVLENAKLVVEPSAKISLTPVKTAKGACVRLEITGDRSTVTVEALKIKMESKSKITKIEATEDGKLILKDYPIPVPRLGAICISGNEKTPNATILKKLGISPGQLLEEQAVRTAEKNLAEINATLTIAAPDHSGFADIVIEVKEQ
jgi:RNA polymerase sigma factor (sigma-70 family)